MRTKPAIWAATIVAVVVAIFGVLRAAGGDSSPLRVVVVPSKTEVRVREPFTLALWIKNISQTNQTIRVMSCSWQDEWKSSNPKIALGGCVCTVNAPVTILLPPGGAYTNASETRIYEPIGGRMLSFRMGFASMGSDETIWSDEVKLRILPPAQNGVRPDAIPKQSSAELDFLADIPSLKTVSLKMSEAELLDIVHRENLEYKRSVANDQTTYMVRPKAHEMVIFGFRAGQCTGIQRMQD